MEAIVRNSRHAFQRPAMWLAATWLAIAVAVWGLHGLLAPVTSMSATVRSSGIMILRTSERSWCGSSYHPRLRFEVLSENGAEIFYVPHRNAYRILGKVRVLGMGLEKVVVNGEVRAPGPPEWRKPRQGDI